MDAIGKLGSAKQLHASTKDFRTVAYLAGHAVETIIVAIGIKQRNLMDVPDNEKGGVWHSLVHLLRAHDLDGPLYEAFRGDKLLRDNWLIVKDWDSNARFATSSINGKDAVETLNAVAHPYHGVFQWLLNRYDQI